MLFQVLLEICVVKYQPKQVFVMFQLLLQLCMGARQQSNSGKRSRSTHETIASGSSSSPAVSSPNKRCRSSLEDDADIQGSSNIQGTEDTEVHMLSADSDEEEESQSEEDKEEAMDLTSAGPSNAHADGAMAGASTDSDSSEVTVSSLSDYTQDDESPEKKGTGQEQQRPSPENYRSPTQCFIFGANMKDSK